MAAKLKVKVGDTVKVIAGEDKNKKNNTGKVQKVFPETGRIIVEGIKSSQVTNVTEKAETLVRNNLRVPDGSSVYRRPAPSDNQPKPAEQPAAGE